MELSIGFGVEEEHTREWAIGLETIYMSYRMKVYNGLRNSRKVWKIYSLSNNKCTLVYGLEKILSYSYMFMIV